MTNLLNNGPGFESAARVRHSAPMRRAFVVPLVLLSACLSNPTPHPGTEDEAASDTTSPPADATPADTGGAGGDFGTTSPDSAPPDSPDGLDPGVDTVDGTDGELIEDVGPDAPETTDPDAPDVVIPPPQPFPPTDRALLVRDVVVGDLDRDGFADLLLTSTPEDRAAAGVDVFLGAGRADLTTYDIFVPTHTRPDAALIVDLNPAVMNYLAVIGARRDQGWCELYPYIGSTRTFGAPIRIKLPGPAVPDGGTGFSPRPVSLTVIDADGDGVPDIASADHDTVAVLAPPAWDDVANADWAVLSAIPPWTGVLGIAAIPGDDGLEWLLALQSDGAARYFASGRIGTDPIGVSVATNVRHESAVFIDLDHDGRVEALGFGGEVLSITSLAPPAASARALPPLDTRGAGIAAVAAADLDGTGAPELVVLERVSSAGTRLQILGDVDLGGDAPTTRAPVTLDLGADPAPTHVALVRLGGDGADAWLVGRDGRSLCYRWDASLGGLARCPLRP